MIIVSGPSTVGKNPLIYKICELYDYSFVVPYTTRKIRKEETAGKDYSFVPVIEFQRLIANGIINEWDYTLQEYYGYSFDFSVLGTWITHGLSRMALRIKNKLPNNIITVFLMPTSMERIYANLDFIYNGRALELRKALVEEEITHSKMFDHVLPVCDTSLEVLDMDELKDILQMDKSNYTVG